MHLCPCIPADKRIMKTSWRCSSSSREHGIHSKTALQLLLYCYKCLYCYECPTATSAPLLRGPHCYECPTAMSAPLLRGPHCYEGPTATRAPLLREPHCYESPTATSAPLLRVPHCYECPTATSAPLLWEPHCYCCSFVKNRGVIIDIVLWACFDATFYHQIQSSPTKKGRIVKLIIVNKNRYTVYIYIS